MLTLTSFRSFVVFAMLLAAPMGLLRAALLSPDAINVSIAQGQSVTVQRSITLSESGPAANRVDVVFLADNTGSMGGAVKAVKDNARAILDAIAGEDQRFEGVDVAFGVGRYLGDPREFGSAANAADRAYQLLQPVTENKDDVQAAINQWYAQGGGDAAEANFFALHQVATSGAATDGEGSTDRGYSTGADTGWRDGAAKIIVWFGDVHSHTSSVSVQEVISALEVNGVSVAAVNTRGSGQGIDTGSQATDIVTATGGVLVNGVQSHAAMVDAILSSVGTVTSRVNLELQARGDTSGIAVSYECASAEGCEDVPSGESRLFNMTVTGHVLGAYDFETYAPRLSGVSGSDRVTVRECVSDVRTRAKTGRVQVMWSDTGAHHYSVQRSDAADGPFEELVTTTSRYSTYLDTGVQNNNTYYYRIAEMDAAGAAVCESGVVSAVPRHMRDRPEPVNHAPVISSTPSESATQGVGYIYQILASDPDGDALSYHLDSAPVGVQIDSNTGLVEWTPGRDDVGNQQIVIGVEDPLGLRATQLWTVQVAKVNEAPRITSSPVGFARVGQAYEYAVKAADPDPTDTLIYVLGTAPAGMLIDSATGVISWTPADSQAGQNPVSVTVEDPSGLSDEQSFSIEVTAVNRAPTIISTPIANAATGVEYNYLIEAHDPDAGDSLSYALISGPFGMTVDANSGQLSWTPTSGQIGVSAVEVKVEDAAGQSDTQTFQVEVVVSGNPPIIDSVPVTTAFAGELYQYSVIASDPDGDALVYRLSEAPAGMSVSESGTVSWAPSTAQVGSHPVTVVVEDDRGAWVSQAFDLVVTEKNTAPVITSAPAPGVELGSTYAYQVIASDDDGDALTYSLPQAPAGMVIVADSGVVSWVPSPSQLGNHSVRVLVSDGKGGSASQSFTVVVTERPNVAPLITSAAPTSVVVGETYSYQLMATDADGDAVTFGTVSMPAGMTVDTSGLVAWSPASAQVGIQNVRFFADDGKERSYQNVAIEVVEAIQPLQVELTASPQTVDEGDIVSILTIVTGGKGERTINLNVDGTPLPVNGSGEAMWTAVGTGVKIITATVSDTETSVTTTATVTVRDPGDTASPVVTLEGPTDGTVVTAPTEIIATITDDNLAGYEVLVAPSGTDQWQVIAKGDANQNSAAVATFDPTMLTNGQYDLAIIAIDVNNLSASDMMSLQVEGDLKVGNFSITLQDLKVPLAGIPIQVTRTYDSRRRHEALDFGHGWSVGYQDIKVEESRVPGRYWTLNEYRSGPMGMLTDFCIEPLGAPVITITLPGGDVEKFETSASPSCNTLTVIRDVTLKFTPVGDTRSTLRALNDNNAYFMGDSLVENGYYSNPVDPSRYELTTEAGYKYTLDQTFGIEKVTDPNGNTLTYTQNGIFHSSGKSVVFERDSEGRITAIVKPGGERLVYSYDGENNLVASADAMGNAAQYTYNRSHGLLDIIDPMGRRMVRNIFDESGRLIAQEDNEGNRTEFNHDVEGRQSSVTDRNGYTTFYYYDEHGNVTTQVDAAGNTWNYAYDAQGNQISQVDPMGNTTHANFDARNNQLSATDELGNTVAFTYNSRGQELTIQDARGNLFRNTYDTVGNLLSVTDPEGNIAGNNINAKGLVTRSTDLNGNATNYTYDSDGNKLTETDPLGNTTRYTYDANGNVLTETRSRTVGGATVDDVTSYVYNANGQVTETVYPDGSTTATEYDLAGNETATVDGRGNRTEYRYDAYGRLVETLHPDGSIETKAYDGEGNLVSQTDALGRTTTYAYDALNRVVRTVYPDGSHTSTDYDAVGRLIRETDGLGKVTQYEYDAAGRRTAVINALGNRHSFSYDADGNLASETDARGHTTTYTYNTLDQRIRTRFHDGTELLSNYDAMGRLLSETDQRGRKTEYQYDALGRLTKVTDATGGETAYTYDAAGNKLTQTDAEGRTTRWTYDSEGRELSRTLPMAQTETSVYDIGGNRVSHTDFNGDTTSYFYDSRSRLVRIRYASGDEESYTYDAVGNRLTATSTEGTTQYVYDNMGRLTEETQPGGSVIQYQYDNAGNRTRVTVLAGGDSVTTNYTYDVLNRLQTVTDSEGTTTYTYDAAGNRKSVTYPNGNETTYDYDALNRLTVLTTTNALNQVLADYRYTLDATGRRTSVEERHNGRVALYSYDQLYRLTKELVTDPINGNYSAEYQHDKVGNRTYSIIDGVHTGYTYDDNDRLTAQGAVQFTYDANGNTLTETDAGVVTRYRYDGANRLTEAQTPGATVTFGYNADGIRTRKSNGGQTTRYVVDSNRDYAQVLAEVANGSSEVSYTYGDDLVSQTRGAITSYHLYDGHGSTRALADETGSLTDSYHYDAFGVLANSQGSNENSYLYTGEQYDTALGQYYLRARYYDQKVGRFTQMDTWMGVDKAPVTLNKYAYGNADPINWADPTGNFGLSSFGTASNIRGTLATMSTQNLSFAISRAVGATLQVGGRATTKTALTTLRRCIRKNNKCGLRINLLIVGYDNPDIRDHIRDAQTATTIVLTYKPNTSGNRRWYATRGGRGGCKRPAPAGQDCDEYPFFKTKEGGPKNFPGRVSLRWVPLGQNRSVGAHFGFLSRSMKKPKNRDFVVITSDSLPSVALPMGK
ncbi:putative Ig domain-containing protein [Marinobacter sp.]|uniref:putative Ig domain-containing protein n=1 Tax=Marinobacter sp. TaxID=50741 RepID=UPI003A8F7BA7